MQGGISLIHILRLLLTKDSRDHISMHKDPPYKAMYGRHLSDVSVMEVA